MYKECGHHCGIKDKHVGHCNCPDCHNGNPVYTPMEPEEE